MSCSAVLHRGQWRIQQNIALAEDESSPLGHRAPQHNFLGLFLRCHVCPLTASSKISSHHGSRELRALSALGLHSNEVVKLGGEGLPRLSKERHSSEAGLKGEGYQTQLGTEEEFQKDGKLLNLEVFHRGGIIQLVLPILHSSNIKSV